MRVTSLVTLALIAWAAAAQEAPQQDEERDRLKTIEPISAIGPTRPERRPILPTVPPPPLFVPMTPLQKYQHNLYRTFDANAMVRTTFTTALDVAFDDPEAWPGGVEGFGIRFVSKTGRRLNKRMIMSTVQATLGHDPRRLPTTADGVLARAGQAFLNTYRSRTDSGGVAFNYSRLLGAYGAGFISRSWQPPGTRSFRDGFMNGTSTMLIDGAGAIFWEFLPDIKRKVFRRR
jgi:hypothetical protein